MPFKDFMLCNTCRGNCLYNKGVGKMVTKLTNKPWCPGSASAIQQRGCNESEGFKGDVRRYKLCLTK